MNFFKYSGTFPFFNLLVISVWIDTVLWVDFIFFKVHLDFKLENSFLHVGFIFNDIFHSFELDVGFLENLVKNSTFL